MSDRFVINISAPGDIGIPLDFAAFILTVIGQHLPDTTMADPSAGAALAMSISRDDLRRWKPPT